MSEDASIRRLRRLLGNQRFDEEAARGRQVQEQEAKERAARNATLQAVAEKAQKEAAETAATARSRATQHLPVSDRQRQHKSSATQTGRSVDASSNAPAKRRRTRVKQSPYSETESETDTDPEAMSWSFDQEAGPEVAFCPILAVNKYPYKYFTDRDVTERVAGVRWNNGQFFNRNWTIFYIRPPEITSPGPMYFVPASEVQTLLAEATRASGQHCEFPAGRAAAGFRIEFSSSEPRPRYLGVSATRNDFDAMPGYVPASDGVNGAWSLAKHGDDRSLKAWQAKLEEGLLAAKQKKNKNKTYAQNKRVASKQQWCRQLRRSQRYLGLRAANAKEAKGATVKTQVEIDALLQANAVEDPEHPPELDLEKPPQFAFDQDVVFVSIDLEAHETMQTMITEVGIATLDTRDLQEIAPGKCAEKWRSLIKYRHFRMQEWLHHINGRFITGCPDRFEKDFGQSEVIRMDEINKVTRMCCKSPFPVTAADRAAVDATIRQSNQAYEQRKIVLVGHNFDSDVDYLKRAGLEILKIGGLIEVLDTSMIHRALIHENNPTSLSGVLGICNIAGWNLHNAGNDAGYTLQALLAMAVDHLANPEHRKLEEQHVSRRETAINLAGQREDTDFQEWLLADRDGAQSVPK